MNGEEPRKAAWHTVSPVIISLIPYENRVPYYLACPEKIMRKDFKTGEPKEAKCGKKVEQHANCLMVLKVISRVFKGSLYSKRKLFEPHF